MSKFQIKKAERKGIFARIALDGVTGGGKTMSALKIAEGLKGDKRVLLIDTERASAERYSPLPGMAADPDAGTFDFDHLVLDSYEPDTYVEALRMVDPTVYSVVIVDSLTHAWAGKGGALEQVDKAASRSQSGNKFTAWRDVTPMHNRLVDALLSVQAHLIVTMRSKMEYVLVENEKGKKEPKRIGLAPIQRDGIEYELDIVADMHNEGDKNRLVVSKTRASFLRGAVIDNPDASLGRRILEWCGHVEPKEPTPTDEQLRALASAAKEAGWTNEQVKNLCESDYDVSPRNLTISQYNDIMQQIKDNPKGEEEN